VVDFTFVDAPFELEIEEGQTVPMRSWWRGSGLDAPSQEDLDAIFSTINAKGGVFDGIIGFSQGGALGAYLAVKSAESEGAKVPSLARLKFLMVAGAYTIPGYTRALLEELPSLHIMSPQDTCVNCSASQGLEKLFRAAKRHFHEKGHAFPTRASDVDLYHSFITAHCSAAGGEGVRSSSQATEEQKEELEAIQAIFMEDVVACEFDPPLIRVALPSSPSAAALSLGLPPAYPHTAQPTIKVLGLGAVARAACEAAVRQVPLALPLALPLYLRGGGALSLSHYLSSFLSPPSFLFKRVCVSYVLK
jgi:hypothetical protein